VSKDRLQVLEKSRPPLSVSDFSRLELERMLKEKLLAHDNIINAYLFGSVAADKVHPWSDIDLIIVAETAEPFIERPRQFFDLYDLGLPIDILVYTLEEFADVTRSASGFWKEFAKHRKTLM
jgi:predicted nucleotidyltransferase